MVNDHKKCPECEAYGSEVVHTEFYSDHIERIHICLECPTQWTVSYGDPRVREVETHE